MDYLQHFDFGAPDNQGQHYALWEPVLNRFLLVLSDLQLCETIKFIASSRYKLFLIDLTTAENYTPTLIDNSCCGNWTFSNKIDIATIQPNRYVLPIAATMLLENKSDSDWDFRQETRYLQFIAVWLKFLKHIKEQHPWMAYVEFIRKIHRDNELAGIKNDWYDRQTLLEKDILKTLYLGNDIQLVHQQIVDLLAKETYVYNIWQRYSCLE